ncbi:MAG: permease [Ectothiorhodospiraceae bacterium]|nr:permease [Ectothiorhodospiraceae bacterium]
MTHVVVATRELANRIDPVVVALLVGFAVLALLAPQQAAESLRFTVDALVGVSVFLLVSIAIAACAKASGADQLIARAFQGGRARMVLAAALVGALSPFCSCGVIPIIAALLAMGVPLPPVMAFWLASPLMDPSMFVLTAGTLGTSFAIYKTFAAVAVGLLGGFGTLALMRGGAFAEPLRAGVGNGGCGGATVRNPKPVQWRFWSDPTRRERFRANAAANLLFLGKWLAIAFFLESLMLAYVPAETVSRLIGGDGWTTVLGATLVGVPAYLNGYAALPLVGGLIEQGMAPGAGMAFLLAGGVSSIPAAIAVWALARWPVFVAYLGFAFVGALSLGLLYPVLA